MRDEYWEALCGMAPIWTTVVAVNAVFVLLLLVSAAVVDYDRATAIVWTIGVVVGSGTMVAALFVRWRCATIDD